LSRGRAASNTSQPSSHDSDKPGLAPRRVAARILAAVVDRQTSLDGMLNPTNGNRAYRDLSPADQELTRAIILASLRHLPVIKAFLAKLVERPLPEGARALVHVLTVAAAQILYLGTPDRAAVDLAVEQALGDPRNRRFAPLVNAVLRRMSREKSTRLPELEADTVNAPAWFADRLRSVYGDATAGILRAHATPAPLDLTVKADPDGWANRLDGTVLSTGSVRLVDPDGPVTELPGFSEGAWWVQDAAAAIPAKLFGDVAGQRIADLCAAPGGKTAQLAAAGARVTALDLSAKRLKRLEQNLQRLRLEVEICQGNLLDWQPAELFDCVLLDAPCSSTGTVRRHPNIPWTKGPEDVARLADLQARMLRRALTLVRPGGTVVFSNCSLDPAEGEDLVAALLQERSDIVRQAIAPDAWPGLEAAVTPQGDIRTTPAMLPADDARFSGLDGFYASVLIVMDNQDK